MKIFQNKIPRTWKSSGITIKNNQIEMSNFSFLEDYIKIKENKFIINIIGKNIIGNGSFSVLIYKNEFLVWQEIFYFKNISFSKKTIEIEEESNQEFKVVISRGKESRGKILIDSVSVFKNETEKIKIEECLKNSELEDEPTFFLPEEKEKISSINIENTKLDTLMAESSDNISTDLSKEIFKEESVGMISIEIPPTTEIHPENTVGTMIVVKKDKKKRSAVLRKRLPPKIVETIEKNEVKELDSNYPAIPVEDSVIKKRERNNIWVHILDLSLVTEEREIFKYINQISFGKEKQKFLVKNNPEVDLSRYNHVIICNDDDHIFFELNNLNPKKITFSEENLNSELLEKIKKIKNEI